MMEELTPELIQAALINASPEEQVQLQALLKELEKRKRREECQKDFLSFVRAMWPEFIESSHHRRMAKLFNDIADGKLKRLIISLPPRHTKSEMTSYLFPAWYMGKYPDRKAIQVSNTGELAEGFGRKVRNLMETDEYKEIFPDVALRADSKAAGRWNTNYNGDYFACGVGAALAGRGANIALLDDVHTEAEALAAAFNPGIYDKVTDWYSTGIRQRLQPGGAIIICMTRWSQRDLIGQILEKMGKDKVDKWEYVEFPAILPSGKPLWPSFWSIEELLAIKAEIPAGKWQAQYMQNPTSDETAIIKRADWQIWDKPKPPPMDYLILAMDTAFEAKKSADYSAAVVFGIWTNEEDGGQPNLMLLEAWRGKLEFPELKAKARELYKEWEPDSVIIEKKASGAPLIYELRRMGIPVQEFTPSRGNDKITRLNAIADIFRSGKVWAPDRRWADELIEEVAGFPAGRYDDFVDCTSLALARFRAGGFIGTKHDEEDEDMDSWRYRRTAVYY